MNVKTVISSIFFTYSVKIFVTCTTDLHLVNENNCGSRAIAPPNNTKIMKQEEFPWMARILALDSNGNTNHLCGGSVIYKRYILSAAHCFINKIASNIVVRLGETDETNRETSQVYIVSQIISHSNFDEPHLNDIALLKLQADISYNSHIRPICLPTLDKVETSFIRESAEVIGWGFINGSTNISQKLKKMQLQILSLKNCFAFKPSFDALHICAGSNNGADACSGDSGGPLMKTELINNSTRYVLIGIISAGNTVCGSGPGIYTRVSGFMDWILSTVQNNTNYN